VECHINTKTYVQCNWFSHCKTQENSGYTWGYSKIHPHIYICTSILPTYTMCTTFKWMSHFSDNKYLSTSVLKYPFSAILNRAFSFIRLSEIRWQITENFDPNIICSSLKTWEVSSWFMEIALVLALCTSALVWKCSLFVWSLLMKIYIHMKELRSPVSQIDLYNNYGIWHPSWVLKFLCNVNTFLLTDELPQKMIPYITKDWK
jgi:hypothetical protein